MALELAGPSVAPSAAPPPAPAAPQEQQPTAAGSPADTATAVVGLTGKGIKEAPLIALLARSQTADQRYSTEVIALQEDLLARMGSIRYNCQYLKYRAATVGGEVAAFSRLVAAEEQQMAAALREMEGLSADVAGLVGMIEHLGAELAAAEAEAKTDSVKDQQPEVAKEEKEEAAAQEA